ncbi:hypothetical protein Tco_0794085 [Tanacetum coccineum]
MSKVEKYVTETLGAEVLVRSTNQPQSSYAKNLYRALLEAYNSDQDILSSYGKEESSKETTQKKSKSTSSSKGTTRSPPKSLGKSVQEEEHDPRVDDLEEPFHQEFNTGNDDVSPVREATDVDERLLNPSGSRTPDPEWNQTKMLNIQHLTQDMLIGPTYDLIKGTCKSVVVLEYHLEEVFKATNDQLDWHNPEARPYPHDLSKPLLLIPDAQGRLIIPYDHFINNDLEYLKGGSSSRKYTTSITKTKAADYGHIKWIEDKIPRNGYSKHRIIVVTSLKIMEFFGYKHLEEITVRRQDDKLYMFQEGDFKRLCRKDIEDMLLLLVHGKLMNLNVDERFALNVALRMRLVRSLDEVSATDNLERRDCTGETYGCWKGPYDLSYAVLISQDCDGIPKRPTMYLNLWSYKVVRHRYSNPMIQPELEGSTQGYPLDSVEVLSNPAFILKASISSKRKLDLTTGINFLGHDLLYDHGEVVEAYKRRRSMLDYRIQQIYKCLSEGSDVSSNEENKAEENKADAEVVEKQAGNEQPY